MLTVFHDPTSPASAIAVARLTTLAREGAAVTFEGFDHVGIDATLPVDLDTLAMIDRLAPIAAEEGIVLRRPPAMPPTGLVHVLLGHTETTPRAHEVRAAVYRAYWEDGADLADPSVLVELARTAGLDGPAVAALLDDRLALAGRRRIMTAHRREGVGGVPVILASRTLVPGLLPLDQLRAMAMAV